MLKIVFLVLLTMTLFLWLLALLGTAGVVVYGGWLAWFACVFLALLILIAGPITWKNG